MEMTPKSECLTIATVEETIAHVYHMVMDDRHSTRYQMANSISISCGKVEDILLNVLGMTKVSAQ